MTKTPKPPRARVLKHAEIFKGVAFKVTREPSCFFSTEWGAEKTTSDSLASAIAIARNRITIAINNGLRPAL